MTKPISHIVGIDFDNPGGGNDDFAVNTEVQADNGIWMRVQAGAALATGNVVHVATSGTAAKITAALAVTGGTVAVVPTSVASGSACWAQRSGRFDAVSVLGAAASGNPLYTTDTAGVLDDATASGSHHQVMSLLLTATNGSSTATNLPAIAGGFLTIRRPPA